MDPFQKALKLAFENHNAGRGVEAEAVCRVLMQISPHDPQLLFLLGMVLHKADRNDEAIKWLSEAALHQPQVARVFSALGCAYQGAKDHPRAAAAFAKSIELQAPSASTCYNFGNTCYQLDRIEQAADLFRRAVAINPGDSAGWNNLGKCLKELNRLEESVAAYGRALEISGDYPNAGYGRGTSLLATGRISEGFKDYEWRRSLRAVRKFDKPEWKGERMPAKTLFLYAEQGYGDALQMVRFIPLLKDRVGRVILESRPDLETLFNYSKCADLVVPFGTPFPPFDYFLPLASLPYVLGVTLETIPNRTPYLQAPPTEDPAVTSDARLNVGLAWAGSPDHQQDAARSIRLEVLMPVLRTPGVSFVSLQKAVPDRDRSCRDEVSERVNSKLQLGDFLKTASIIAGLDLVITVDTAVAHLAGAMGKPVWLLLQHSPDWRWFLDRSDSPWYPTMKLFRQTERGNWETPILRVAEELRQMSGAAKD